MCTWTIKQCGYYIHLERDQDNSDYGPIVAIQESKSKYDCMKVSRKIKIKS